MIGSYALVEKDREIAGQQGRQIDEAVRKGREIVGNQEDRLIKK